MTTSTPSKKKPVKKASVKKEPVKSKAEITKKKEREHVDVKGKDTEIIYDIVSVKPYFSKERNPKALGSLTAKKAKEILRWEEEPKGSSFGKNYLFKDRNGKKIRCVNNLFNRPFTVSYSQAYMLEILRGKWKLNGETMIIDRTGMVQDAQHRLVALVWAAQEWSKKPDRWEDYWKTEPTIDTIIVTGIMEDDDTVNTINTGAKRTLSDVIYRSEYFQDFDFNKRRQVAKMTEWAVKVLWRRSGQSSLSKAPKMPHSEALVLVDSHSRILEAVRHVYGEDGSNSNISGYIPAGQAAGLLYLMAGTDTDRDTYLSSRNEEAIDFNHWDEACDFWTLVAQKGKKVEQLLEELLGFPENVGPGYIRSLREGLVAKSWGLFRRGKAIKKGLIEIKQKVDEDDGKLYIIETPLIGGIDIGDDSLLEEEGEDE